MQKKIDNAFSPIIISSLGLGNLVYKLNELLGQLEKKRIEFNNLSKQTIMRINSTKRKRGCRSKITK